MVNRHMSKWQNDVEVIKVISKQAAVCVSHSRLLQVISKQAVIIVSHSDVALIFTSTLLYTKCCPFVPQTVQYWFFSLLVKSSLCFQRLSSDHSIGHLNYELTIFTKSRSKIKLLALRATWHITCICWIENFELPVDDPVSYHFSWVLW